MSCSDGERLGEGADTPMLEVSASDLMMSDNPFFRNSQLQLNYPEFNLIKNEHYLPAFEYGMTEHLREIKEIAEQIDDPGFENTIVALELSGQIYSRVARVFSQCRVLTRMMKSENLNKISRRGLRVMKTVFI